MILGSARLPIVLLDASAGLGEILFWVLAGSAALAFSWFVGLLLSLRWLRRSRASDTQE